MQKLLHSKGNHKQNKVILFLMYVCLCVSSRYAYHINSYIKVVSKKIEVMYMKRHGKIDYAAFPQYHLLSE